MILIDPANPFDFDAADLTELVAEMRVADPDNDVSWVKRAEVGYGGPYSEVLHVWIDAGGVFTTGKAVAACVKWMKARWERDREAHPPPQRPRRRYVQIHEVDIHVRSILIDLPDGDPVDQEIGEDTEPPHRRPKS